MNLPIGLYPFIFRYLGLKDLVRSRRVSKLWKSEIDRIRIQELVIEFEDEASDTWNLTGKPTNPANLIRMGPSLDDRKFFKQLTSIHLLDNLQRLKIGLHEWPKPGNLCMLLIKLPSLEQLEIEMFCVPLTICHPKLQFLYIEYEENFLEEEEISIVCPHLKGLNLSGPFNVVDVVFPESILSLSINSCHEDDDSDIDLKKFESLQHLSHDNPYWPFINLSDHPDLKVFQFSDFAESEDWPATKEVLVDLMNQKQRLKRSDLKIYFRNTLLISVGQLAEIDLNPNQMEEI